MCGVLRRGKNTVQKQLKEGNEICERSNPADTNVGEEGEGASGPGTGADYPLQPLEKTMVVPL